MCIQLARLFLVTGLLVSLAPLSLADVEIEGFTDSAVVVGLITPTAIAFLPDGRLLVTEQDGSLLLADVLVAGPPVTLAEVPVAWCQGSFYETGLLGVAVDPAFAVNGFLYLYRTTTDQDPCTYTDLSRVNEVIRVTMTDTEGGPSVDLGTLTVLLGDIQAPLPYHCGGCLRIGPDDKLYVSTGDTYTGDDPDDIGPGESTNPNAQDLTTLEGKVLRLELDGSIPADNPFVGAEGGTRGEIFAYGFRNPWRFGFDDQSGLLWLGDVGQATVEEIDIVVPGGNYGWPRCEGKSPGGCHEKSDVQPVYIYPHTGKKALGDEPSGSASVTGGAFAPGPFGYYGGIYFFADFEGGTIYAASLKPKRDGIKGKPGVFATNAGGPADLVFGTDSSLYYTSIFNGQVRRIAQPASGGDQSLFGKSLALKDGKKKGLTVLAKDVVLLGGGDDNPTLSGGTLQVTGTSRTEGGAVLFDDTYPLPAKAWKLLGKAPDKVKGFKYTDKKLENGPINNLIVKDGKLIKMTGKGEGLGHSLAVEPGSVQVVLTLGTRRWCLTFNDTAKFKVDKSYRSKNQEAGACPP
jgi:glucose/arabinose dehydrogenase